MLKEKQTVKQYRRYIELFCSLVVVCFLYAIHMGNLKTAVDVLTIFKDMLTVLINNLLKLGQ